MVSSLWFSANSRSQDSLDQLVRRIPEIAVDTEGIGWEEQKLAEGLESYGAKAIPFMLPLLENPEKAIREFAGYVLADLDGLTETHLDALMDARRHGNAWIPPAIARIGSPRAIAFLVDDLRAHPEPQTQVTGALQIAGEKAAIALANSFRDPEPLKAEFAHCVGEILTEMQGHAVPAIDPLLEVATGRGFNTVDRQYAVQSIGCLGPFARRAIPVLRTLAKSEPDNFTACVEQAIIDIGGPEATPLLIKRLSSKPDPDLLRDIAALREDGRDAGSAVAALLAHADHDIRVAAASTLGFIGQTASADALAHAANDADDWMFARAAAESLGRLCAESGVPALEQAAAAYWYPPVRSAAKKALEVIHGESDYAWVADGREFDWEFFHWSDLQGEDADRLHLPDLMDDPDSPTPDELQSLSYGAEIDSYGETGEHITKAVEQPGCGLRVAGGLLLGATRGEWGGELVYVKADTSEQTILRENTIAVYLTPSGIVAVTGLAHLSIERGVLYKIDPRPDGFYTATWWKRLPGEPSRSGLLEDGSLFIRCRGGDVELTPDGRIESAHAR